MATTAEEEGWAAGWTWAEETARDQREEAVAAAEIAGETPQHHPLPPTSAGGWSDALCSALTTAELHALGCPTPGSRAQDAWLAAYDAAAEAAVAEYRRGEEAA